MAHPKSQEVRARATAKRRGLNLTKSHRRDPHAPDYNRWRITTPTGETLATVYSLDAVEDALDRLTAPARQEAGR